MVAWVVYYRNEVNQVENHKSMRWMDLKNDSLVPYKIFAHSTALFRPLLQEIITIEHTLFLPDVQIKADFTFNSLLYYPE